MPVIRCAVFALLVCVQLSSAQTLLFKSGFESNTVLQPIPSSANPNSAYFQKFNGTDTSTGFSWPPSLFGTDIELKDGGTDPYHHYFNSIVTETGHTGASTKALHAEIDGYTNFQCCPQAPFQSGGMTQPLHSVYYSVWLLYPTSLTTQLNSTSNWGGRELHGWKSATDYKETLGLVRIGGFGTTLQPNMQSNTCGKYESVSHQCPYFDPITGAVAQTTCCTNWTFAHTENTEYQVPIGRWFHIEIYERRVHGPGGVQYAAIDGHVVGQHDYWSSTYGTNNEEIQDMYWVNLYGSIFPLTHDIDDLEIWDSPPCGHFPCQAQAGGTPPDLRNWQGAVGAVGVPFSFQPVAAFNPTSWTHYGGSLPPGLSQSNSTGLISGTPTTSGTYKTFIEAVNSSGNSQMPMIIQINSSVAAPVIKTFGAYPTTVASGTSSTLYANVLGAGTVSVAVDQGVGTLSGLSASKTVTPGATTTYTLVASNSAGTRTATTTVTVSGSAALAPTISSFTASPGTITAGSSSSLAWSVSGTTPITLSINQGVGTVTGTSKLVTPSVTTAYTLTASNLYGSATRNVTVTVNPVVTFTPTARRQGAFL